MPRPPRYKPRDSSRRRVWIYLAVIAFVVVDMLLIGWALGARNVGTPSESFRPIPTFTPNQLIPTPTAEAAASVAMPSTRLLSALDDTTAWRATTGECPTASAMPELSTDAGATWVSTDATGDVQITALQRLDVVTDSLVELIGLSAQECTPQFARSFVAGADYSDFPSQLGNEWYLDPADRSEVQTPAGVQAAPCASLVALAPRTDVEDSAAVLCGDTQVFTTDDSGITWSNPIQMPGSVNLAVTPVGYVIATVGLPECAGVQLTALSADLTKATPTGCLPVDEPVETMQGNVAVSEAAGTLWVWVSDLVMRSNDQGTSWQ